MPEASGSEVADESDCLIFENKTGLAEDMKFLASMPELCDVTFLVGDTKEPICAVKAVLAARSRVFQKMFYQAPSPQRKKEPPPRENKLRMFLKRSSEPLLNLQNAAQQPNQHQTVIIEEFEPDVFRQLIEYIHTGCVTLQPRTLLGLMNAADYYGLDQLRKACTGFVQCCITVDTVCALLASAERYIQYKCTKSLVQKVLEFVDEHGNEVLNLGSFTLLPQHVVRLILGREELRADEFTKFQAALMWSKKYCDSNQTQSLKDVISNFLEYIHFHKIPANVLMREVHPLGLVPSGIIVNALAYQADPTSVDPGKLSPHRVKHQDRSLSVQSSLPDQFGSNTSLSSTVSDEGSDEKQHSGKYGTAEQDARERQRWPSERRTSGKREEDEDLQRLIEQRSQFQSMRQEEELQRQQEEELTRKQEEDLRKQEMQEEFEKRQKELKRKQSEEEKRKKQGEEDKKQKSVEEKQEERTGKDRRKESLEKMQQDESVGEQLQEDGGKRDKEGGIKERGKEQVGKVQQEDSKEQKQEKTREKDLEKLWKEEDLKRQEEIRDLKQWQQEDNLRRQKREEDSRKQEEKAELKQQHAREDLKQGEGEEELKKISQEQEDILMVQEVEKDKRTVEKEESQPQQQVRMLELQQEQRPKGTQEKEESQQQEPEQELHLLEEEKLQQQQEEKLKEKKEQGEQFRQDEELQKRQREEEQRRLREQRKMQLHLQELKAQWNLQQDLLFQKQEAALQRQLEEKRSEELLDSQQFQQLQLQFEGRKPEEKKTEQRQISEKRKTRKRKHERVEIRVQEVESPKQEQETPATGLYIRLVVKQEGRANLVWLFKTHKF